LDKVLVDITTHSPKQLDCFDSVKAHVDGVNDQQLFMFLTGPGGCGKSKLLKAIAEYTRLAVGRTKGTTGPVAIWTPSGCAGYAFGGVTWQSALGITKFNGNTSKFDSVK